MSQCGSFLFVDSLSQCGSVLFVRLHVTALTQIFRSDKKRVMEERVVEREEREGREKMEESGEEEERVYVDMSYQPW